MYEGRSGQAAVPPAPARKTGPDVPAGRAQDVRYIAYSPQNTQEIDNTIQLKPPIPEISTAQLRKAQLCFLECHYSRGEARVPE